MKFLEERIIHKLSSNSRAIFYAILTCFFVSIMVAIVRHLSDSLDIFFIVMMRNFFALLLFMPLITKTRFKVLHTKKPMMHVLRNANGLCGMMLWFYVITIIPLPEAVSITFTVPIITTFAAMFFLKEKVDSKIWIALIIGAIGIIVIIRPGFRDLSPAYLLAILATFSWAISNILIKKLTATDSTNTIVANMSLIMFVLSLPLGIAHAQTMIWSQVFWLGLLGLSSNLAQISMSIAYSKADINIVQPFDFTRLIFISIIAYFAFDEQIDIYSFIGSGIIMFGTIFVAPKRNKVYNAALPSENKL